LGKIKAKFGQNRDEVWAKMIRFSIEVNLIRFGQNQNLASLKAFDLLRLCVYAKHCYNARQGEKILQNTEACVAVLSWCYDEEVCPKLPI